MRTGVHAIGKRSRHGDGRRTQKCNAYRGSAEAERNQKFALIEGQPKLSPSTGPERNEVVGTLSERANAAPHGEADGAKVQTRERSVCNATVQMQNMHRQHTGRSIDRRIRRTFKQSIEINEGKFIEIFHIFEQPLKSIEIYEIHRNL